MKSTSVAIDVESKALVESENEKNATIVEVRHPGLKDEAKLHRGSALKQVIAAFVANLGTINTGLVFGFSAVTIPQLEEADSFIKIDEEQASWIASLSSITTPIGCILSGYLMDLIGRKRTLIITEIPLILGWILISTSRAVETIYVGRLLVGLGSGMVGAPARVYTGEVTQPHLRGMLSAVASVGVSLGVTVEYTLGAVVTWTVLAGISATIPILALILIIFIPETPNWLLTHGRTEEAKEALARKLRRPLHRHTGKNLLLTELLFVLICLNAITSISIDNKEIFMSTNNQLRENSSVMNFENVEYITYADQQLQTFRR